MKLNEVKTQRRPRFDKMDLNDLITYLNRIPQIRRYTSNDGGGLFYRIPLEVLQQIAGLTADDIDIMARNTDDFDGEIDLDNGALIIAMDSE